MKNLLLTAAALTAFTLSADAQMNTDTDIDRDDYNRTSQVTNYSTSAVDRAMQPNGNPDMDRQPVVDYDFPDMNLPGMNTVYYDANETAPLRQGFTRSYGTTTTVNTTTTTVNTATEADPQEGRWIDRDNDGYDPVIDEIEQGAETAVKATGEALNTVGNAIDNTFDKVTGGDEDEEKPEN